MRTSNSAPLKRLSRAALVAALAAAGPLAPTASAGSFMLSVGQGVSVGGLDFVPGVGLASRLGYDNGSVAFFGTLDHIQGALSEDDYTSKASSTTIGGGMIARLSAGENAQTRPYISGQLFTVIPTIRYDDGGSDGGENEIEDVSSYGLVAGFGAEYRPAKRFGVGGEAGPTIWRGNIEDDKATIIEVYGAVFVSFYL